MRAPIRIRLAFWFALVMALILFGIGGGVYFLLDRALEARAHRELRDARTGFQALLDHESWEEPAWNEVQVVIGAASEAAPLGWRVAAYHVAGDLIAATDAEFPARLAGSLGQNLEPGFLGPPDAGRFGLLGEGGGAFRAFSAPVGVRGRSFTAVFFRPTAEDREVMRELAGAYALILPAALLLTGFAGYFFARTSLAPVAAMAREAERIGAGNLQARLPRGNPHDELGGLAAVFNDLLGRIEAAFGRQRKFMTDASHELRTPIAIIRGEAEVALSRSDRSSAEYRESLEIVQGEAGRVTRIVDDLFTLARADAGQHPLVPSELYLDELLAEVCHSFRSVAVGRSVGLGCDAGLEAPFRGDTALLRRLLLNLLDNATRHTPPAGRVDVSLRLGGDSYEIVVSDTGSGIPEEAVPHLFDRFFRADPARSRVSGQDGAGLGLPIARWIAEAHGGSLVLRHTGADGTTFLGRLPHRRPSRAPVPDEAAASAADYSAK